MKAPKPRNTSSGSRHQASRRAVLPKPPFRSGTSIEDIQGELQHGYLSTAFQDSVVGLVFQHCHSPGPAFRDPCRSFLDFLPPRLHSKAEDPTEAMGTGLEQPNSLFIKGFGTQPFDGRNARPMQPAALYFISVDRFANPTLY